MLRSAPFYLLIACLGFSALAAAGAGAVRTGDGARGSGGADHRLEWQDDGYASEEYDDARRLRQRGDILPLERILQAARRQRDGRVLETGLTQEHGRYIYNVELVDDKGRVWEMELDATTGEVLENRLED